MGEENEIEELVYFGKAWFRQDPTTKLLTKILHCDVDFDDCRIKEVKSFIIRRKRHLEMMYTNGFLFWTDAIEKSQVKYPYYI